MFGASCASATTYIYDSLNRLTGADYGNGATISFSYDAAGNRLSSTAVAGADTSPDAFSFSPLAYAPLTTLAVSNSIAVTGITAAAPISVSGGQYSIDGSAWAVLAGTVLAGQAVQLRLTSSASYSTAVSATLDIGGVSGTFTVTTQSVTQATSATNIVSSVNPSTFGQNVAFTATVTGSSPTGTITFNDSAPALCTAMPLAGGHVQCTIAALSVGSHGVSATYSGDAANAGSNSAPFTQVVGKAGTSTILTAHTPAPSGTGSPIAVSASVAITAPGAGTPSGTVTISDGAANCLIALPATNCNLVSTSAGVKTLTASYAGDGNFAGSTSAGISHTVYDPSLISSLTVTKAGSGSGDVTSDDAVISCGGACAHDYNHGTSRTLTATAQPDSVFAGWLGACTGTAPCHVTMVGPTGVSATFAPASVAPLRIDVDGNNAYDALTDGLIMIRYMFGLAGTSLIADALGDHAALIDPTQLLNHLNDVQPIFDVDGNGRVDALTDGLLLIRYLFGLRGASLITGAVGLGATRTDSMQIETYIESLLP